MRRLLVLDSSYLYSTIVALGLEQGVVSRDLGGFFNHVWTVNPFGDVARPTSDFGTPEVHKVNRHHTFIQARFGRFRLLALVPAVNFLVGQIGLLLQLRRLIRREGIDLVRGGDPLYVGLLGWALAKICGTPLSIRINAHNERVRQSTGEPIYPRLLRSVTVERIIERFVLKRASLVVAPNQDNVDFAIASGARADRTVIFPYGNLLALAHMLEPERRTADPALFKQLGIAPGHYLLCVSRLKSTKYPDDAMRSLGVVRRQGHDVKLVLAGDGEMRSSLEKLATELGIHEQLIFAGNVDQDALAQLYANAAVVVSPLTGRALSEAALGAAPIVAYDLDWQGDLIVTGDSGELVPFRDQEAFGEAVVKLLDDRKHAQRMGKGARARALTMFDPKALLENERSAYRRLLEQQP